jgi:dTMP kinase
VRNKGVFICIEGIDASGKTTHARRLVRSLQQRGFDTIYTTEPSQDEIGQFIRKHVLQRRRRVSSIVEALLFAADRVDHVEKRIKPALQQGRIVVSDRYVFSSLAYQGATGLDLDWIEEINRWAPPPDLAVYIDVPPEVVLTRIRRRKSVMERLDTQRRVEQVYQRFVKTGKLVRIDGNRRKNEVATDILSITLNHLKNQQK